MTHASWAPERTDSYERLAFVGDSLLSQIVTLHLDAEFPRDGYTPGTLTRIRAKVVSDETLRAVAAEMGLDAIAIEEAPAAARGRARDLVASGKPLASMFEALVAACWQQYGPQATSSAVIGALAGPLADAARQPADPKTLLQERLARLGRTVRYEGTRAEGPDHAPLFDAVALDGNSGEVIGRGRAGSKKAAEAVAAEQALGAMAAQGPE